MRAGNNIIITDETFKTGHKLTNSLTKKACSSTTAKCSNTSELCWRGWGLIGDLVHLCWDCPKLQDFWKNVQREINQVMDI